jgi:probable HAF family extracellular repeat protein
LGASPGGGTASQARAPIRYDISDLGTFGGPTSVALGINDNGQVVGSADLPTGQRRAYIWEDGVMTQLSPLPGDSTSADRGIIHRVAGATMSIPTMTEKRKVTK